MMTVYLAISPTIHSRYRPLSPPIPAAPCDIRPPHTLSETGGRTHNITSSKNTYLHEFRADMLPPPKLLDLPTRNIPPGPNWPSSNLRRPAHNYQSKTAYPIHEKQSKTYRTFNTPPSRDTVYPNYMYFHQSRFRPNHFVLCPSLSALPWICLPSRPGVPEGQFQGKKRTAETDPQPG